MLTGGIGAWSCWRVIARFVTAFLVWSLAASPVWATSDFVEVGPNVSLGGTASAWDYRVETLVRSGPTTPSFDYTTGWLAIDLTPNDSNGFTQVGIATDGYGPWWFVYTYFPASQIQCLRGSTWGPGGQGCAGNYGDIACYCWHVVELVTYGQGYWIVRVYDGNSGSTGGHDVARIYTSTTTIYGMHVTGEEAYLAANDPNLRMDIFQWHPQYMIWGTGFQDWPAGDGTHLNSLFTQPSSICPGQYAAIIRLGGDPRYWWTGSSYIPPSSDTLSCSVLDVW